MKTKTKTKTAPLNAIAMHRFSRDHESLEFWGEVRAEAPTDEMQLLEVAVAALVARYCEVLRVRGGVVKP